MKLTVAIMLVLINSVALSQKEIFSKEVLFEEKYFISDLSDSILAQYSVILDSLFESGTVAELTITLFPSHAIFHHENRDIAYQRLVTSVNFIQDKRKSPLRNVFIKRIPIGLFRKNSLKCTITKYSC